MHRGQSSMVRPQVKDAEDIPGHKSGKFRHRAVRDGGSPRNNTTGRTYGERKKQTMDGASLDKSPHLGSFTGSYQEAKIYGPRPGTVVVETHHQEGPVSGRVQNSGGS